MKFRSDITPGDYLLIHEMESMYIIAYSMVDKYRIAPFTVWVYDDYAFGYGMKNCATYEVQHHGAPITHIREWPSTWAWTLWEKPKREVQNEKDSPNI